jgi:hypothetical protein
MRKIICGQIINDNGEESGSFAEFKIHVENTFSRNIHKHQEGSQNQKGRKLKA